MNTDNYVRTVLVITEFDAEDVITTSGLDPDEYEGGLVTGP